MLSADRLKLQFIIFSRHGDKCRNARKPRELRGFAALSGEVVENETVSKLTGFA